MAIFWHIPWPNPEAFGICPWQRELLDGLLGADLIGFHIQAHCNNFLETVDRALESRIDRERFAVNRDGHHHAGAAVSDQRGDDCASEPTRRSERAAAHGARRAARATWASRRRSWGSASTASTTPRASRSASAASSAFFEKYPVYQRQFTFVQIGAPSRTHIQRYHDLMDGSGARSRAHQPPLPDQRWKPIVFLKRHHSHEEILPYYRTADLCLVTSLHDGMNLVAKEFVASRATMSKEC